MIDYAIYKSITYYNWSWDLQQIQVLDAMWVSMKCRKIQYDGGISGPIRLVGLSQDRQPLDSYLSICGRVWQSSICGKTASQHSNQSSVNQSPMLPILLKIGLMVGSSSEYGYDKVWLYPSSYSEIRVNLCQLLQTKVSWVADLTPMTFPCSSHRTPGTSGLFLLPLAEVHSCGPKGGSTPILGSQLCGNNAEIHGHTLLNHGF